MIPKVVQVKPINDFKVYVYFADGKIKLFDVKPLIARGGVFDKISDLDVFKRLCTVLNGMLAWDVGGNFDDTKCIDIDIDPVTIYETVPDVEDPLSDKAV